MNENYKDILLVVVWVPLGVVFGLFVFTPIFEDTFMGAFMGFLIGAGMWLSTRKKMKK